MIKQQVLPHCTPTQPQFPHITSVFQALPQNAWCVPQGSVSPWSAWRREASAARRSQRRLVSCCRQRSAGCRGCARMATWRRATSGDHARRLVCIVFSLSMLQRAGRRGCGEYLARHTFLADSVVTVLFCSIPRFKRSFLLGFLWFLAVSLAAFFLVVLVIRCCLPRIFPQIPEMCTMFFLLLSCSRLITLGRVALASSRVLPWSCSSSTSCGPTSPSSGCSTKIDALGDDETQLRLTASQTVTTRGMTVSGIMDAYDVAPRGARPETHRSGVDQSDGRVHGAQLHSPYGAWAQVSIDLGQRAVAREQAGLWSPQYSVARHSRVSTSVLSRPLSLRLLFVEQPSSAARSASCSCQSFRITGTLDPRVSQDVGMQPRDVRENR